MYHALRVFKIKYNLDLKNHKMQFEINIQCMMEAIFTKILLLSMLNNNGFELDQIYSYKLFHILVIQAAGVMNGTC